MSSGEERNGVHRGLGSVAEAGIPPCVRADRLLTTEYEVCGASFAEFDPVVPEWLERGDR